jgi:hypothetical protein
MVRCPVAKAPVALVISGSSPRPVTCGGGTHVDRAVYSGRLQLSLARNKRNNSSMPTPRTSSQRIIIELKFGSSIQRDVGLRTSRAALEARKRHAESMHKKTGLTSSSRTSRSVGTVCLPSTSRRCNCHRYERLANNARCSEHQPIRPPPSRGIRHRFSFSRADPSLFCGTLCGRSIHRGAGGHSSRFRSHLRSGSQPISRS